MKTQRNFPTVPKHVVESKTKQWMMSDTGSMHD